MCEEQTGKNPSSCHGNQTNDFRSFCASIMINRVREVFFNKQKSLYEQIIF